MAIDKNKTKLTIEERKHLEKVSSEALKGLQMSMQSVAEKFLFPAVQTQTDLAKQITEPLRKQQEAIKKAMEPMLQANLAASNAIKQFAEQMKPAFTAFTEQNKVWTEHAAGISEAMKVWHEKSKIVAEQLQKDDVFLIPYFGAAANVHSLVDEINKDKSMLEIYEEYFSIEEHLMELLDSWMENDFFKERKQILEKCLKAHLSDQHELNIPTMYIHIEAYCKKLVGYEGQGQYDKWKKKLKQEYRSEKEIADGLLKYTSEEYTVEILTEQIFRHYKEYEPLTAAYPNRHNVQHGDDIDYYKKDYASLRCILLLDVLSAIKSKGVE